MRPTKRPFCQRILVTDFAMKLGALLSSHLIIHLWTTETKYYNRLPAKSYFEYDLYFHTLLGYMFVLAGQLLLYFIGEIPTRIVQRVVLLYGAALYIICGVVGFINYFWLMKNLQIRMLAIALLCFVPALCMMWDHLWQEEYFKTEAQDDEESGASSSMEPSSASASTATRSNTTNPSGATLT